MTALRFDLHTHTTYSDGYDWEAMAAAASEAGLAGIGFTDHCPVVDDGHGRIERYDFPETYEQRRAAFHDAAAEYNVRVFDGAEVNYDPTAEDDIRAFLDRADFEYTIGSVHTTSDAHIPNPSSDLVTADEATRRELVDTYVEHQIALVDSELFDVLGHLDLPQRTDALFDVMDRSHHERLAEALANSRTVPEINAGRLNRSLGTIHPDPAFLDSYAERDVSFVIGTDSHAPDQLTERVELLAELIDELNVEIRPLPDVLAENTPGRRL